MSADGAAPCPPTSEIRPDAAACTVNGEAVLARGWQGLLRIPASALVGLIRVYQHTLSPALPILTLGRCGCRFAPTCSHYAVDAIRTHGASRGLYLAAVRLLKCTPLHPGGFDPVPARTTPVCRRTTVSSSGRARSPSGPQALSFLSGPPGGRALPSICIRGTLAPVGVRLHKGVP